ncbi:hypothetical protein FH972_005665 [Carpinus fangiana]|uniref:Uncharacterized protein n=1 Tax=Carpinus fangiana TaxID=176857 RepID=A0A5N6QQY1_9ROSI|nr:hypothetical protein FH972_005665 [Carpinus fangiana]
MVQRKYIRIYNVATEDDEMQDPCTGAHITQDVLLVGHPHDSSLASQGICGESSRTTERAPPPPLLPRYKKGDVIIIDENGFREKSKLYFDMSLPLEEVKKLIIQGLGTRRKEHKYELKHSLNIQPNETPKMQAKAKKNKESREKQILQGLLHTTGSRSFARSAYEEESITGWGPDRSMLFRKTHTGKDGKPVTKKAESKMAQIDELMAQEPPSTQGSSQGTIYWALNDPYSKVLSKERSGRVNGVGSVCIPLSSASTSRMPLGTCNDPEHAGIENLKKKCWIGLSTGVQEVG